MANAPCPHQFQSSKRKATRTPEGGPYKPFIIKSCADGGCIVETSVDPVLRYLPDHPDANTNGYVAFPKIDRRAEYMTLVISAKKLRQLAEARVCRSAVTVSADTAFVRYQEDGNELKEDQFTFDRSGNLVTWSEVSANGVLTSIGLTADGKVLAQR